MGNGYATLHALDGFHGRPAADLEVTLYRLDGDSWSSAKTLRTSSNGRTSEPLLSEDEYAPGRYRVVLDVGDYFARLGAPTSDPPYLTQVLLQLNFAEPDGHYHVPVTVTPWGFTHFRGSS